MKSIYRIIGASLLLGGAVFWAACGDDNNAVLEPAVVPDGGVTKADASNDIDGGTDSGVDSGPKDCFDNPTTAFEIINACTDATRIAKDPNLPLRLMDGGLPTPP